RPGHLLIANLIVWAAVVPLCHGCGVGGCPTVERLAAYQAGGAPVLRGRYRADNPALAPGEPETVAPSELPAPVPAAFLAIEDMRFYARHGVDFRRIVGALVADVRAHGFVQGFSTITMQLARNVWPETLPGRERTLQRKILEVRVAR